MNKIEEICIKNNVKLTKNKKILSKVICDSNDHPDIYEIHKRSLEYNPKIGIATIYRIIKEFEDIQAVIKYNFNEEDRSRYEELNENDHHDHIIDIDNNKIIEFYNEELEKLKEKIVNDMGYDLIDHKLELYVRKKK